VTPFAILLKTQRGKVGISQDELGRRLNLAGPYINRLENGRGTPHVKRAPDFAKVLGVSEKAILDAIMASKFPGIDAPEAVPLPSGMIIQFTPDEERSIREFAHSRMWRSAEDMIRQWVLANLPKAQK